MSQYYANLNRDLEFRNLCFHWPSTLRRYYGHGFQNSRCNVRLPEGVGISYGTLHEAARRARGVGADIIVRPPASSIISLSSSPMSEKLVPFLMKQPHVTLATGTMGQPLGGFDVLTGIDLAQFNRLSDGFRWVSGGPFESDDDVIVDEFYAREKKLSVGSTITLANHAWRVSGIFESGKLSHICARLSVLQTLTGNSGRLSQIYLKVDDPTGARLVVDQLRNTMPGYFIYTMEEFTSLLTINSVGLLRDFIGVVIGVALVVGFIVVTMAMYTAVLERTREIGILKALGASSGYILNLLFRETLLIAILGSVLGIAMTDGSKWLMMHAAPSSLAQETVYSWWPIASGVSVIGALLGAVLPAWKAVKQDVIQALAYE